MKKLLLSLMLVASSAFAWEQQAPLPPQACNVMAPYGAPQVAKADTTPLCRPGYFTLHDNAAKIPVYAVYILKPENALGCFPRTNAFTADLALQPGKRATPTDYAGSGYDQGHNVPDGDLSYNQQVEWESFLMSNMMPQLPGLNRGIWKQLESNVRAWSVQRNHNIQVMSGPVYGPNDKTIGKGVVVPSAFWKVVVDLNTGEHLAFGFQHRGDYPASNIAVAQVTVAEIEQLAQVVIPLPPGSNKASKAPIWPADLGGLTKAKQAKCK